MSRKNDTTIKLKNSYFESLIIIGPKRQLIFSNAFKALMEKSVFPQEFKPRYWLGRAFDKIIQELNKYTEIKQKLIRDHTKKYEKDGSLTKEGKVVKKWKKGDPVFLPDGTPDWIDFDAYMNEFKELLEIEVDIGIRPIAFDPEKGPDVAGHEMLLLLPLLKEPIE